MGFLEVLEEQCRFGFTGKLNILKASNKQFLGSVYLLDGEIIRCKYKSSFAKRNLFNILIDDISDYEELKFVAEPEVVEKEAADFRLSIEDFKNLSREKYKKHLDSEKLAPPRNLRLVINQDFIIQGDPITSIEFDVLKAISDYNKIDEIYNKTVLYEYEVTEALVSLRKKKAIKVYT